LPRGKKDSRVRLENNCAQLDGRYHGLDEALERYRRDLTELIAACRERGVEPIFITQPTLYKANLPPELDSLLWMTTLAPGTAASVMDAFNETMRAVCQDENVPSIDIAPLLPKDTTVFYDDCHFNVAGCQQVASILSEQLEDELMNVAQQPKAAPTEKQVSNSLVTTACW